ncbi:hypothetical protein PENTCL1PPCAC_19018, partial [Pristionchus entomophagus]
LSGVAAPMFITLVLLSLSILWLISSCSSCGKGEAKNLSSVTPKRPTPTAPPQLPAQKESTLVASVTPPESPPRSNHSQPNVVDPTTPLEGCAPSKGASPSGSACNTGTGEVLGGTTPNGNDTTGTGQGSAKRKDLSVEKQSQYSQESGDLMIQTLTSGPDSLLERGNTTKTKEPDGNSAYQSPCRKKGTKKVRASRRTKTLQTPSKKMEKEKKEPMTSSSGNRDKGLDKTDDFNENTPKDPTDEREKKPNKAEKTTEDKRSMEAKLSTCPTLTPVDSTQVSHTHKEPSK